MEKPKKQVEFCFEGEKSFEDVLLELIIIKIATSD